MPVRLSEPAQWSLARRQQVILISSLTFVALILGLGGFWYISEFAERASDRVLRASANAVSETIALERGEVTLEVPPGAFGMLEDTERDNVYYSVKSGSRQITGYEDFPKPRVIPAPDETDYRYDAYRGQPVRVATQARYLIDPYPPVVVQVAETLDERHALVRHMLLSLIGLEAALIGIAALLIGPAIRWGIAPATRLRETIEARKASNAAFQPLDPHQVPQELRGLIATVNLLLERLNQATRRIREFTGDASHQMRTPLAALRTQLHLAREPAISQPERDIALHEADAAAERLQQLISQLLALARAESAVSQPASPVDLAVIVADIARDLAPRAIRQGVQIQFDANPGAVACVHTFVLAEMLSNLIDNAIRYGRPNGSIMVRVCTEGPLATIHVEDDGPGIPPGERAAVLQRFYRLARDKRNEGSGLGLSIVQSLADVSDGSLSLGEREGGGLSVQISFPLATPLDHTVDGLAKGQ